MLLSLKGQTALVTGASGGLGQHFATTLATAGATVILAARRTDRLEAVVREIEAAGGRATAVAMDVTDADSVVAAFRAMAEGPGVPTVVVNNAGVTETKAAIDLTPAEWDRIVATNLTGCFTVAAEAARRMSDAGRSGTIVNIASILGLRVGGMIAPYCAAKAGLIHLTKALALEWARHGIRVNALAPGYIETDLNRDFFASETGRKMIKRIPLRRLGQPQDLDGPLLLLCSEAASWMTGSVLAADGGHLVSSL